MSTCGGYAQDVPASEQERNGLHLNGRRRVHPQTGQAGVHAGWDAAVSLQAGKGLHTAEVKATRWRAACLSLKAESLKAGPASAGHLTLPWHKGR